MVRRIGVDSVISMIVIYLADNQIMGNLRLLQFCLALLHLLPHFINFCFHFCSLCLALHAIGKLIVNHWKYGVGASEITAVQKIVLRIRITEHEINITGLIRRQSQC